VIRIDLPPAGRPKGREPGLKVKNRPRNPSSTRKSRNAKMTRKCHTGESHGTLGQNFSKKKVLKNFERKWSGPQEAITVRCKKDRRRNPEFRISIHCSTLGQNFSIFKKLEKFIQHYILGQIFPFLSKKNWKNSKKSSKWAS
jgi:hypothetical protein